jgi:phage shock protein PspC (stress-responsive transcriptional regulator)
MKKYLPDLLTLLNLMCGVCACVLAAWGFFWQAFRDKKGIQQFWVVFFLFFMTGIAIVIYLNQTPLQPRERDYAYAGSFYAFSIWCGLGIAAIYELLGNWLGKKMEKRMAGIIAGAVGLVPAVAVPAQMVSQTWDDHDRSDRYMCRDFGLNYLETIPHDGVIFTNGDNDTFPLWYNEDTEGKRTDVRVCNLSYLQTDWYIDQMKRPAFSGEGQSSPLPISWKRYQYTAGKQEMTDVNPEVKIGGGLISMKDLVKEVTVQDPALAKRLWGDNPFELKTAIQKFLLKNYEGLSESDKELVEALPACLPSDTLCVTVNKEAVRRSGMKIPTDSLGNEVIPDQMAISLAGQGRVSKSFIMMLEMIAQSNFSRPLYMSTTVGSSNYGNLWRHFVLEGMAWRITPFVFPENEMMHGVVHSVADTEKMYDNMMNKYHYGNLKQPGLYIDETTMRMCYTHRRWFSTLITSLIEEGKKDKALKALEKCEKEIPAYNVPHDLNSSSLDIASAYIACDKPEKAQPIFDALEKHSTEYIKWYLSLSNVYFANSVRDCHQEIYDLATIQDLYNKLACSNAAKKAEYEKKALQIEDNLQRLYSAFVSKCEGAGIQLQ